MTSGGRRDAHDGGAALVIALLTMMLLMALGLAVAFVGDTDRLIAANYRRSVEGLFAADAAIGQVRSDLAAVPNWSDVLAGSAGSAFVDSTRRPRVAGTLIDLDAATVDWQAQSDAGSPAPANRPVWRLFAWGPVAAISAAGVIDSPAYVAAWVADDWFETDGDPLADTNGVVFVHVEGYGQAGARRMVEAVLGRSVSPCGLLEAPVGPSPPGLRLATFRAAGIGPRPAGNRPEKSYWTGLAGPTGTIRAFAFRLPGLADLQMCATTGEPALPELLSWREVR